MRILHVEKTMPAAGGIGACLDELELLQRAAGHEVFRFGCAAGPAFAREMPRFIDFAARRRPLDLFRMVHNAEAAGKLARFLGRTRIDVAHLHNVYHHLTPSILPVLAERGAGIVMTVHDYRLACPTKHFARPGGLCMLCLPNKFHHAAGPRCAGAAGLALAAESFFQRLLRRYFRWVDLFLCPTRFMRGVLLRAGAPAGKLIVVPNPVGSIRLSSRVKQRDNELLYFGRLNAEKAPEMMLALAERLGEARVSIVGGGPMQARLESAVARRALKNVTVVGHVDRRDAGGHLARAAAVVMTSRCMENSPCAMLEAMAAGRCVIVPDQPPLREWVEDGRTGRTYAPGDEGSLATVAAEVLADPSARDRMAAAAAELIAERHDPAAVAAKTEDCYRESIKRCGLR